MNNSKPKGWLLLPLGILLTIASVILVWNRQATLYPYLMVAVALAVIVVLSIVGYYRGQVGKPTTVFLILVVFVLLRNVQFIATHYSAMQPGDVVQNYAVINTFSQAGRLFVIPQAEFCLRLAWYSSWPALHSLSLIFADVLGIELAILPVVLPTVLGMIGFAFVYLLADKLAEGLKLNRLVVPIALLLYAISPEAIYHGQKFVHQGMATLLVLVLFYLIYKYLINRDVRILALVILNSLLLVAAHHYTSFVFMGYLLAFGLLTFVLTRAAQRIAKSGWLTDLVKPHKQGIVLGLVGLVMAGAILAWWSTVGTIITDPVVWTMDRIKQFLDQIVGGIRPAAVGASALPAVAEPAMGIARYLPRHPYPPELTPPWLPLLWIRSLLIYAPVFFGFAWLFRVMLNKKLAEFRERISFYLLTFSLSFFGVLFAFELFVSRVEPIRVVLLALPFIAVCGAILYAQMLSHKKWLLYAGFSLVVFAVTMSFLGLWGHMHAPVHLYSSAISHHEVGEATPLNERHYALQTFVAENHLADAATAIISDDHTFLYLLLSPQHYLKFGLYVDQLVFALEKKIDRGDSLMVVDFNTRLYTYYTTNYGKVGPEEGLNIWEQYRSVLEGSLNKVYDNTFEVWVRFPPK